MRTERVSAEHMSGSPAEWASRAVADAPDPIVTTDARHCIVQFNRAAEVMFACPAPAALGRPVGEMLVGLEPDSAASGQNGPVEARARRADATEVPVEVTVVQTSEQPLLHTVFIRELARAEAQESPQLERLLAAAERLAHMGTWELDLRTLEGRWSDELFRIHGLEPGAAEPGIDMLLEFVHPDERRSVSSLMRSIVEHPEDIPPQGLDVEYRVVLRNGAVRELRAHGRVEGDDHGPHARWVGSAQDITEQRLVERELHAHYAVSQSLREWESFEEGIVGLLRRLGTALDFPLAVLWTWDAREERLTAGAFWAAPDVDAETFVREMSNLSMRPDEGLPGKAWAEQRPFIAEDVATDPNVRNPTVVAALGVKTVLAFPAGDERGPVAVLTFYSFDPRRTTDRLVRTLTGIGREVGRFLGKRRARLEQRRLSDRELQILSLAAEGNSGPEIAERLVLSPATVKTHFEHIYEKLGFGDRAAAVAYALRIGLID
jgi:DNA-binding CsgD family transcriptional regulator/PAS domain-containing protein